MDAQDIEQAFWTIVGDRDRGLALAIRDHAFRMKTREWLDSCLAGTPDVQGYESACDRIRTEFELDDEQMHRAIHHCSIAVREDELHGD